VTRTPYGGGGLDAAVRVADGSLGDADRTVAETRERATPAAQLALERQQRVVRAARSGRSWRSISSACPTRKRRALGIPDGTVMSRLHNARRKAAEAMRGDPQ
jgi:hypothetical protein